MEDNIFLLRAIELAKKAEHEGNLPVGAVITYQEEVIAEGRSAIWVPIFDATRHAEMEVLRAVPQELWKYSTEMSLYTTLEPCLMCFGAILLHRIGRIVFGSNDDYGGAGPIMTSLPIYFQSRIGQTDWVGPSLPDLCDPLHKRLITLENARSNQI